MMTSKVFFGFIFRTDVSLQDKSFFHLEDNDVSRRTDPLFTLGAIGAMKANQSPFSAC